MNILHLTADYPPPLTGGLPRQVHGMAHALADRHNVGIVTSGPDKMDGRIRVYGSAGVSAELPVRDMSRLASINFGLVRGLVGARMGRHWDVIHAHDWMVAPVANISKELFEAPIVTSIHTNAGATIVGSANDLARRLDWEQSLARASNRLVACSSALRDIVTVRYPAIPCTHIPNGILVEDFTAPAAAKRHSRRLLFVGRLVPYKGCQDAIRAVSVLRPNWQGLELEIIGDGYYRSVLETLVDDLQLRDAVRFLGWKDGPELAESYHHATVVVVPSHEEAFGLVAIEAMAASTPVVATEIAAFESYIRHGQTGLLAEPGSPDAFAREIERLLSDQGLRNRIVERATTEVVPLHDWSNIVTQMEEIYHALAGE